MRVAIRKEVKTNSWEISIIDVSPSDLVLDGDEYTVRPGATFDTVTSTKVTGGPKNATSRTKRLANRNDAVALSDIDLVAKALKDHGVTEDNAATGEQSFSQADLFDAMDNDGDDDDDDDGDDDGDDLDLELLTLGWKATAIGKMKPEKKRMLVDKSMGPLDLKKADVDTDGDGDALPPEPTATTATEEPPRRRRRRRRRRPEPEQAAAPTPEPAAEEKKTPLKKKKAPAKKATTATTATASTTTATASTTTATASKKADKADAPPRGYSVRVTRDKWDKVDGKIRKYDLGQTPDKSEADEVATRWKSEGFTVEVAPLAAHHKARAGKRTIYTGDPVEPILCLKKGCNWAGDHLGPHLKSHDLTLDQYRATYKYKGPAMVGRALTALERAHSSVRRRNDLNPGMVVVDIQGSNDVEVWRVDRVRRKELRVHLVFVTGGVNAHQKPDDLDLALGDFFERFAPVGNWSQRLIRDTRRQWRNSA